MKLYLLVSPIVPIRDNTECSVSVARTKDINIVKELIENYTRNGYEMVSAIGHRATAKVLSNILGFEIQASRIAITLEEKDVAIAFSFDFRLPEGAVLDEIDIMNIVKMKKYSFTIIRVNACWGM